MAIERNRLPIPRDRYDALRLDCKRWRSELESWRAELQDALPDGEPLAEHGYDHAVNAVNELVEAMANAQAVYQWATGVVSNVKVKALT